MYNGVIKRDHARERGLHDHLIRTAEARRRQAELLARGVHRAWTVARRALERLINGKGRERLPAANGTDLPVADAVRRDWRPLARLVRRYVLEPYARRRRRRLAIAQLRALDDRLLADIGVMRGQIELAVEACWRRAARDGRGRAGGACPRRRCNTSCRWRLSDHRSGAVRPGERRRRRSSRLHPKAICQLVAAGGSRRLGEGERR
jgi:uncharacterized protein YjiS (DUF1127 family)